MQHKNPTTHYIPGQMSPDAEYVLKETREMLNMLSQKIDSLKEAMLVLTAKLDAEDVTNLDKNYTSQISSKLS